MSSPHRNPKINAVNGLGELVDEAVEAMRQSLTSEVDEIRFAAAKYVLEKMATPKAVHTILDPATMQMLENDEMFGINSIIEAFSRGDCTFEEISHYMDMKKNHIDITEQLARIEQINRIRKLEDRKLKLITVKTDDQRLEEAMS